jgi:hypothetical protein
VPAGVGFVGSALNTRQTFTDPSFVFAAGLDIFTGRHLSIRPDVSVRLVTSSADAYAVTMAALRVTYHFEVHDTKQSPWAVIPQGVTAHHQG